MAIVSHRKGKRIDFDDPSGARERLSLGIVALKDSPATLLFPEAGAASPATTTSPPPQSPRTNLFGKMAMAADKSIGALQQGGPSTETRPSKPSVQDAEQQAPRDRLASVQEAKILTQRAIRALAALNRSTEGMSREQIAAEATLGGERSIAFAAKVAHSIPGLDATERADFATYFATTSDCFAAAHSSTTPEAIAAAIGRASEIVDMSAEPRGMARLAQAVFSAHIRIGAEANKDAAAGITESGRYMSSFYHLPTSLCEKAVSEIVDLVEGMVAEADLPFADAIEKVDYSAALIEACTDLYLQIHREYIEGVQKRIGGVKKEVVDSLKVKGLHLEPMFVKFRNDATIAARVALEKVKRINWRFGADMASVQLVRSSP